MSMNELTGAPPRTRLVEIVIPVHNEERVLESSVRRLHGYLAGMFPYGFRITIADNASTDATWPVAKGLAADLPDVRAVHLAEKGRGRALRHVWAGSDADVVAYMDVDLSTDLDAFLPLVAPLLSGHSDLAIGTRLDYAANVVRGPKREVISRAYNLLLRSILGARFSDAQCGFKAVRAEVAQALLPSVRDEEWFFDTELLLLAERHGLRIHEVPVDWVDDPDSRVDIVKTALDDLRGMARVALSGATRQLPIFAVIGVISTLAHLGLFVALRQLMPALAANALALFLTAIANTAANRRFTFGVTGRAGVVRHQLEGGVAFVVGLGLSTGGLALLDVLMPGASTTAEVVAVVFANGLATLVRFLLLRTWVFNLRRPANGPLR
ncbi:bifunctional glycosyltransferase family 2/GtrA family protein [Spongiactinospora sp. TRM90649]|uniref:bifunctional glycosyltransferase family 2/GtrA family protein n=1 Tax=Spongiactinospora sp. TRM90649 TaxID=3031114 RepID=UPI0023F71F3C|nr:bifunctional glycosyltransferase family 2/GtrA family protein [Spongiactinospora sp. TRM90649]MDF5752315.1 bifunctional glycosyltransferase family 2/GtrA family protein [Spongiactinospora sp. TRM90649]